MHVAPVKARGYLSPASKNNPTCAFSCIPDWKDFAVVLSVLLVVVGAAALATAAQTFTIIKGKVLEEGVAVLDLGDGMSYTTNTISVLIENDDRVFRIERGTVVKYAISDDDAQIVNVGSEVELLISSYRSQARVVSLDGESRL